MKGIAYLVVLVILFTLGRSEGANVLFLSPHTSHSHTHFFHYVIKELASRGHSVTHYNGLLPREDMSTINVTQLYSSELHHRNTHHQIGFDSNRRLELLLSLPGRLREVCASSYADPAFRRLVNSSEKFDLIVIEAFMNECMLPFTAQFDAPFVYLSGLPPSPWMLDATCTPLSPAYSPALGTTFTEEMSFVERLVNTGTYIASIYFRRWFLFPLVDSMAAKAWTNGTSLPPVADIERDRFSLLITNTHFSLYHHYPKLDNIVEAAGLHLEPPKPLAAGPLLDFLNESGEAGFIVLSFGTIVRSTTMPEETRRQFVAAFARLPQRVLWKWEDATGMPDLSPNVRLVRWLPPLLDLMAHPKMKLFMTHGGLFSNQEAVWSAMPLMAMPVFADQHQYATRAQRDGYAIHLDWQTLTADILYQSITEIVTNPKYKERARQMSILMRDQMGNPLDRAVSALEYVIRHRGAPHLRPAACRFSLLQRESLDIFFILSCCFLALLSLTVHLMRKSAHYFMKGIEGKKLKKH